MAGKKSPSAKPEGPIRKLDFLIGQWHTSGQILQGADGSQTVIRGMDTYEWIAGGHFILHRVDVFMGKERSEVIEIIGYDKSGRSYFMKSFDNKGEAITMHAVLQKPGVLKLGDNKMRSTLTVGKNGNNMTAKWELAQSGKTWVPWMHMKFDK